ncbi:bifunctional hydroxymethylpyrimidine kinase/phosphomethylpyrimidine kinase [Marinimicrobium sp. ABcell2]|uniref:bifunctional hydroxymethylpyrimidine kinase/phosphomethylpyrimidine kinase n=1 Tax=Marinimicrobium sp. ABcell2 TaxID=3069751 RepID=UPI0027B3CFE2|nr:bifunctional hydroxymethylpyrimidine kinase/phosphomethylpyrimidine kinase [Marinimicrobium sp. ABcell2]MDQ2076455.1 bifunctional hydroxymethylpyrimidine kinase/phosphomethylpyrimidine kinase [Marinimicrobium sp. ABcell2]
MAPIAKPSFSPQSVPIALTVAGSDSGAGAGIQADLKTFAALGVYGCSAITSLTAQNTCGVQGVFPVAADFVAAQMHSVLSDMPVAVIKTGMLANAEVIQALVSTYDSAYPLPLVVDPVMLATSGDRLLEEAAVEVLIHELLPRATLITPNLLEAAALLGESPAQNQQQRARQAERLLALGPQAVLLKGGHDQGPEADDLLLSDAGLDHFSRPRVNTRNTHGTGCTLAAAIAAGLAKGLALPLAVEEAKDYLQGALLAGAQRSLGSGASPVDHFYRNAL